MPNYVATNGPDGRFQKLPYKTRAERAANRKLLGGIGGNSPAYRRFAKIAAAIASDQGGVDELSAARLQLIKRFSAASVLAEQMEARLANGEDIDIQEHALLCSSLVRLGSRIGIDRRAIRDITPTLDDIADEIDANKRSAMNDAA